MIGFLRSLYSRSLVSVAPYIPASNFRFVGTVSSTYHRDSGRDYSSLCDRSLLSFQSRLLNKVLGARTLFEFNVFLGKYLVPNPTILGADMAPSILMCPACPVHQQPPDQVCSNTARLAAHFREAHNNWYGLPLPTFAVHAFSVTSFAHCECGLIFASGRSLGRHRSACRCRQHGHRKLGPHPGCTCTGCHTEPLTPSTCEPGVCAPIGAEPAISPESSVLVPDSFLASMVFIDNLTNADKLCWRSKTLREIKHLWLRKAFSRAMGVLLRYWRQIHMSSETEVPGRSLHLRRLMQLILLCPRLLLRSLKPARPNSNQRRRPELFALFHQFSFNELYHQARADDVFHELSSTAGGPNPDDVVLRRCTKLVSQNRLSAAATALENHEVASAVSNEEILGLQAKFPSLKADYCSLSTTTPLFPEITQAAQLRFSSDDLLFTAKKSNYYTAPGPSGMTVEALLYPLKKLEQTPVDLQYTEDLKYLIEQIVRGDTLCTDYLLDSRLVPVRKPDGGIRPICVGEVLRRFASRLLLQKFHTRITQALSPFQSCLSKSGLDQNIFCAKEFLASSPEGVLVSLDLANAFNEVSRASIRQALCYAFPNLVPFFDAFYSRDVNLFVNNFTEVVVCSEGVCQGDAWGPALFCLAISQALSETQSSFPDCGLRFYADDGILMFRDTNLISSTLTFLAEKLDATGLNLRMSKCVAYSPSTTLLQDMFPTGLQLLAVDPTSCFQIIGPEAGFRLLGSFVGSDDFIIEQLSSVAQTFSSSLGRLQILKEDPQLVLLLLRYSLNTKLCHILRTAPRRLTSSMAASVDNDVNNAMCSLFGFPAAEQTLNTLDWPTHFRISRLPGHRGGLGITALSSIVDSAFVGGFAAAWPQLSSFSPPNAETLSSVLTSDVVSALWNIWGQGLNTEGISAPLHPLVNRISHSMVKEITYLLSQAGVTSILPFDEFAAQVTSNLREVAIFLSGIHKLQHRLTRQVQSSLFVSVLRTLSTENDVLSRFRLARFLSQASSECMLWCGALPTSSELVIPPGAMSILLRFYVGLPLPGFSRIQFSQCTCSQSLGHEGYHLLSCYRTFAHDKAVRVLHSMCRTSKLASEVEPVGILHGERRPDLLVSNLLPNGMATILDFATVDPTREASINSSWSSPGAAILQREQEKYNSYQNQYNLVHYAFSPLVMELSGRMSQKMKSFMRDVSSFASRHLPDGGVGQRRFRSRFGYIWKTKLNVVYLKALASSALHTQQQILDNLPSAHSPIEFDFGDLF